MAMAHILRRGWALLDVSCVRTRPWELLSKRHANRTVLVELLKDVERLGEAGDLVPVKPGRMRNHLYPNKEAIYAPYNATPTIRERERREIYKQSKEDRVRAQLSMIVERLTTASLEIRRPLSEGEAEDTPITAEIVCKFVRERLRIDLSTSLLDMPKPLERSGEFEIPLKFMYQGENDCTLKVKIVDASEIEQ